MTKHCDCTENGWNILYFITEQLLIFKPFPPKPYKSQNTYTKKKKKDLKIKQKLNFLLDSPRGSPILPAEWWLQFNEWLSESFSTEKEGKGKAFRMGLQGFSPRNFSSAYSLWKKRRNPLSRTGFRNMRWPVCDDSHHINSGIVQRPIECQDSFYHCASTSTKKYVFPITQPSFTSG